MTIFAKALQTWISKIVHTDHPFGGSLFLVLVNDMTYLYHSGNKKKMFGFCMMYELGWAIKPKLITGAFIHCLL